jgi:hypothetical protein
MRQAGRRHFKGVRDMKVAIQPLSFFGQYIRAYVMR